MGLYFFLSCNTFLILVARCQAACATNLKAACSRTRRPSGTHSSVERRRRTRCSSSTPPLLKRMKNIDSDAHKVKEAAASSLNSGHNRKLATSVPMQLGRVSSILSPNASYEHCPIPATLSAAAKSPLKRHRRRCGSSTPLLPPLAWPPRREVIPLEPVTYTFAELQSGRLASSSKLQLQASTALSSQSPQPSLPQAQHAQQQLPP